VARVIGMVGHCIRGLNYLGLPALSVPCRLAHAHALGLNPV
jgi:hypothetical protein